MTFRDDREAQKHRIDALEDELAASRAEAERLRDERDAALEGPRGPKGLANGSAVWVEWNGKWYRATVVDVLGASSWQIHYDGWSSQWDEPVGPNRIAPIDRPPPGPRAGGSGLFVVAGIFAFVVASAGVYVAVGLTAAPAAYPASSSSVPTGATAYNPNAASVGDSVWVLWSGTWYPGTILSFEGSTVRVHYDGWSDSSDEAVTFDRLMQR